MIKKGHSGGICNIRRGCLLLFLAPPGTGNAAFISRQRTGAFYWCAWHTLLNSFTSACMLSYMNVLLDHRIRGSTKPRQHLLQPLIATNWYAQSYIAINSQGKNPGFPPPVQCPFHCSCPLCCSMRVVGRALESNLGSTTDQLCDCCVTSSS